MQGKRLKIILFRDSLNITHIDDSILTPRESRDIIMNTELKRVTPHEYTGNSTADLYNALLYILDNYCVSLL